MGKSESGAISKLLIKAYSDEKFSKEKGEFKSSINPEDLTINNNITYNIAKGLGYAGGSLKYSSSEPSILSFKLCFDSTGIHGVNTDVESQLKQLHSLVYSYQDDTRSPYYLRVIWGTVDFKGRLANMVVNRVMFQTDGKTVRAYVNLSIIEALGAKSSSKSETQSKASKDTTGEKTTKKSKTTENEQRENLEDKNSAHEGGPEKEEVPPATNEKANSGPIHETKEGDTVPKVANEKLGTPNMGPALATQNGLNSLRGNLPSGLPLALGALAAVAAGVIALALLLGLLLLAKKYAGKAYSWVKKKV